MVALDSFTCQCRETTQGATRVPPLDSETTPVAWSLLLAELRDLISVGSSLNETYVSLTQVLPLQMSTQQVDAAAHSKRVGNRRQQYTRGQSSIPGGCDGWSSPPTPMLHTRRSAVDFTVSLYKPEFNGPGGRRSAEKRDTAHLSAGGAAAGFVL